MPSRSEFRGEPSLEFVEGLHGSDLIVKITVNSRYGLPQALPSPIFHNRPSIDIDHRIQIRVDKFAAATVLRITLGAYSESGRLHVASLLYVAS